MNKIAKLIVLRYALLPRQLLSFEFGYTKDAWDFSAFFTQNLKTSIDESSWFLAFMGKSPCSKSFEEKCCAILRFSASLPFVDWSSGGKEYNPFNDFVDTEVDSYFLGDSIPRSFNADDDEVSIFYVENPSSYYDWYRELEDKSLAGILELYLTLLNEEVESGSNRLS